MLTLEQLAKIFPNAGLLIATYIDPLNATMFEFEIDTPLRMASFLAQIGHESGQLRYVKELASGEAYEGRKDLGNTEVGDGVKFKGRGLIQITGRANYTAILHDLGIDCVRHPSLLEQPVNACRVSGWYWDKHNLNALADRSDQLGISGTINCGRASVPATRINGLADRLGLFERAKEVLKC